MFLAEGMADTVRRAVNPQLTLGPERGGAQFRFEVPEGAVWPAGESGRHGGCDLHASSRHPGRRPPLSGAGRGRRAAVRAQPDPPIGVGAVVSASRREDLHGLHPRNFAHAPCRAGGDRKALDAGAELRGAAIYSSMEPCSQRKSEPESCTQLILRHGFARVVFALYEPDRFVRCRGAQTLREAGVDVRVYPELAEGVRRANAHLGR